MPTITLPEATEKLARAMEKAGAADLIDFNAELHPRDPKIRDNDPKVNSLGRTLAAEIRGLEPETLVDLWNVVFSGDRNVFFDEEENAIRFNERVLNYAD